MTSLKLNKQGLDQGFWSFSNVEATCLTNQIEVLHTSGISVEPETPTRLCLFRTLDSPGIKRLFTFEIYQRLHALFVVCLLALSISLTSGIFKVQISIQSQGGLKSPKLLKSLDLWCIIDWYHTNCLCVSAVYQSIIHHRSIDFKSLGNFKPP